MTFKKDEAIKGILKDFEKLANLVLEQTDYLEKIMTAEEISVPDELLKKITKNELAIDHKEVKLSEKIVNTIVLYHPVASELRKLMACYRILTSLERIGDHVLNIANIVSRIKTPGVYDKLHAVLNNMTLQSNNMVKKSLLSFLNDDRELAVWTLDNEGILDEGNHRLLKKSVTGKRSADHNKHLLMSIITIKEIMSDLERIADQATNIAEAAIYAMEGKDVRHHNITEK